MTTTNFVDELLIEEVRVGARDAEDLCPLCNKRGVDDNLGCCTWCWFVGDDYDEIDEEAQDNENVQQGYCDWCSKSLNDSQRAEGLCNGCTYLDRVATQSRAAMQRMIECYAVDDNIIGVWKATIAVCDAINPDVDYYDIPF